MHGQAEVGVLTSDVSQIGTICLYQMRCFQRISGFCCKITYFAIENNTNMSIFCFLSKVDIAILPSLKYGIIFDAIWRRRKLTG